jgi:Zn-dependent protease with chaperone function
MTPTYLLHGATLALAWFGAANLVACAAVAWAARARVGDGRPRSSAWWLTLRCLPALASIAFVAIVFVPSYLRFEPRETLEGFDLTLTVCAAGALGLVAAAAVRGVRAWLRSRRQAAVWLRGARPLAGTPAALPAYAIGSAPTPLMALAGIRSPRVFVSDRLIATLTASELEVTLAHEWRHARSRDNLKRLLMRLLPDALAGTSIGAAIERRWASAAEHAADRGATAGDADARCALASALVKVARLMPVSRQPESGHDLRRFDPISTLVGGGDLASRVESLLDEPAAPTSSHRALWVGASALAGAAVAYAPLLHAVHEITEVLVNSLP